MSCVRRDGDAAIVTVRLTPRADRDAVEGTTVLADGTTVLKARVRAVPEDGAANTALIRLLAETLGVPKSQLAIASGATQRLKQVRVAAAPDVVEGKLGAARR